MGSYAIPTANTIRKFIAPEDQWPINDVWAYHDMHHTTQNFGDFINAVDRYGKPNSMEDFSRKSQFVTYDAWRNMLEAWNSRMWNNTTGLVLWMSHPAWPSMIWQTYTYDYETPGSYFGAKKACEPIHIQMNLPENDIMIINTTLHDYKSVTANLRYIDLQGKELYKKNIKLDAKANSATKCFIPEKGNSLPKLYLARLELKDAKGKVLSVNDYWMTDGNSKSYEEMNKLATATVDIKTTNSRGKILVEVSNPSKVLAAAVKLNAVDKKTEEVLLPAYFSDGYINLLAGEKRTIELVPRSRGDDGQAARPRQAQDQGRRHPVSRIIADQDKVNEFIDWLPRLEENEMFYTSLFARSKYHDSVSADKQQLKRFTSNKEWLLSKIIQSQSIFGSYCNKNGTAIPQEAIAIYIIWSRLSFSFRDSGDSASFVSKIARSHTPDMPERNSKNEEQDPVCYFRFRHRQRHL